MDTGDTIEYLPQQPLLEAPVPGFTSPTQNIAGASEPAFVQTPLTPYPGTPVLNVGMGVGFGGGTGVGDASVAPVVQSPAANPNSMAFTMLTIAAGAAIGGYYMKSVLGGVIGALYGGTAVNAVRAAKSVTYGDASSDKEALVSATYALVAGAAATALLYKVRSDKKGDGEEVKSEGLVGVK